MKYELRAEEALAIRGMESQREGCRVALLEGPPGCGKTSLAEFYADQRGARLVYALLHSWSDDQELCSGIDVAAAVEGDAARVRQPGVLAVAAEASQAGPVVLCLDEVDKVQERTENLLLDFLQTGRVPTQPGHHIQANLDNMVVFITSNATRELGDAFMRRCRRVRMQPLPATTIDTIVAGRTGVPRHIAKLARRAAIEVAQAEGNPHLSLQEIQQFTSDCWYVAQSAAEVRVLLGQWAARTDKGAQAAARANLGKVWGEIVGAKRNET